MKICMLSYRANPYCGGQGIYLKYASEGLARQGYEVHVVMGPPYVDLDDSITCHQIENDQYNSKQGRFFVDSTRPFSVLHPLKLYEYLISRLGAFPEIFTFSIRAFLLIKRLHRQHTFDVIYDNQCLGYGFLLLKILKVPIVTMIHHPLSIDLKNSLRTYSSFLKKFRTLMFYPVKMQSFVARRMDHIISVSHASAQLIERDFAILRKSISVVYNGVDTGVYYILPDIKKIQGKIVFIGNTEDPNKGFHSLLRALSMVNTANISVTAVDGGSYHKRVTNKLIDHYNITTPLDFTGKIPASALVKHINQAELVVIPSVFEGFGFPVVEAMACGVCVITSDGGALPEVVGDAGIIVQQGDSNALARAIDTLLADEQQRKQLGMIGLRRVREKFTWERHVEKLTNIFQEIVEK